MVFRAGKSKGRSWGSSRRERRGAPWPIPDAAACARFPTAVRRLLLQYHIAQRPWQHCVGGPSPSEYAGSNNAVSFPEALVVSRAGPAWAGRRPLTIGTVMSLTRNPMSLVKDIDRE